MTTIELEFTTNMMSNQGLGGGGGQAPQGVTVRIMQPGVTSAGGSERDKPSARTQKISAFEHNEGFEVYKPNMFTITAYLPNDNGRDGEKRLKLQCYPGMTVQEVIDSQIPSVTHKPYVVYQFPSRALLNPEKEASMLQDQEIWIEPAHMFIQAEDSGGDERLAVVRELFRTEDAYLEHLKNIFDIYIDPMRHWGVSQSDMNTLFVPLSRLCDLLMNFFSELELAVKSWNTNTTLIGGLFTQYPSYWEMYIEYAQSYTLAMDLLKQMKKDESFSKFLDIKRGAAMHTLESLMLLPVQRVSDYKRYLTQLLALTHRNHPDYQNIRVTVARTEEIIQARADELLYLQNESKLEQVQLHFPNDELFLFEKLDMMDASTPKRSRSLSHAQPPVSKSSSGLTPTRQKSNSHLPEHTDNHPVSSIPSYRKAQRLYILEGPVKLLGFNKHQQQDRYLFLFSDLLIIAKPGKSRTQHQRVFKLKNRLRLSEVWVSESVHDASSQHESAFTIGWPIVNYIALFSNPQLKELWCTSLLKQVNQQRQLSVSDSVSIRILNMIRSSSQQLSVSPTSHLPEFIQVHISENCLTVLSNALQHLKCTESVSEFQLWVKLVKEDKEELLQGHECIFAIQSHHNRHQIDLANDSNPQQLEFVVRRKPQHDITRTSSRSGLRGKIRMLKKRSYKPVKMFSVPLEDIIINNQLPEKLQEMLIRLWVDGTTTSGIFRLNGNARKIREVKEAIDGRKSVDIADEGIHVISSLLKELLRNVPGGILPSSRYTEFVATNDITDETIRIQQIRKVLGKLPVPNQVFLRYLLPLLHHIAQYEELNKMSTTNLAICFAPSLLEPDYSLAVIKNEAPTLVEFMIRHSMEIYNNELPELFRQADIGPSEASESEREMGPVQYVKVKDDDTSGGGTLSSNGSRKYYHQRNLSMESTCTSASEDSFDEDDQSSYQHLSQADGNMTLLSTSSRGQVSLLSGSISTGVEGDMSDIEDDESMGGTYDRNKWPITSRQISGAWPRPPYLDAKSRRHSFVSQSLSTKHYSPDLASSSILGAGGGVGGISPLSRSRNSSHGIGSPMFPHRVDHLDSETTRGGGGGGGVMHTDPGTSNSGSSSGSTRKKRKKPGHSNSFSKSSDLPHIEPRIPQSTSFSYANDYDSLLPAAADSRPRSHTVATNSSSRPLTHSVTGRDTLTTSLEAGGSSGPGSRVSSAGMTRSGGWNQQGLSSNRRSGSPDDSLAEFMNTPFSKLNPELIKQTISHRFNLTTTGGTSSTADKKSSPPPTKEDIKSSRLKESSDTKTTPSAGKYSSYQQQSSPSHQKQMKRVESVDSTTASIDDRPEAERHLNSLPRSQNSTGSLGRRSMFATSDILSLGYNNQSESGSQLTIGSGAGYSSDTESSPSRTLNRPDKLSEVTGSPYTIPSRYSKYNNDNNTPSPKALESFDRPPSIEEHSLQKPDDSSRQSRSSLSYSTRESYVKKRSSLTSQSLSSSKGRHSSGEWEQSDNDRNLTRSLQEPPPTSSSSPSNKKISLSSKSFDDEIGPMPAPHIGTRQLGSTLASHDHKSRSMPGERNVTRKHTVEGREAGAVPYVKTERVVRYELPVPKKIRRINLRAYNNAK